MQPKRLLDAHGAPSDVSRLLRAARHDTAPAELRRTTWKALAAQTALTSIALGSTIPAAAKGAGAVAAGASGTGGSLGAGTLLSKAATLVTVKSLVIGVSVGGGIATTYSVAAHFTEPAAEQWTMPRAGSLAPASHRALRPLNTHEASPQTVPEATGEPSTGSTATKPLGALHSQGNPVAHPSGAGDSILVEARRVSEARAMVRHGKGLEALRKLSELDVACPGGVLRQERDALRIDALFLAGQKLEAQKLARQFAARYSESPLVARWSSRGQ